MRVLHCMLHIATTHADCTWYVTKMVHAVSLEKNISIVCLYVSWSGRVLEVRFWVGK